MTLSIRVCIVFTENYNGVLNFQGVVLIRVRREEGGFVGQGGRGLSEDSGIKF